MPRVLGAVKCGSDTPVAPLPTGYNAATMNVKRSFETEVKRRQSQLEHGLNLKPGQKYGIKEMRARFKTSDNEGEKKRINILEAAFRKYSSTPIDRELNRLRRIGIAGQTLLQALQKIYLEHGMQDWPDRRGQSQDETPIPRIICSEALVKVSYRAESTLDKRSSGRGGGVTPAQLALVRTPGWLWSQLE